MKKLKTLELMIDIETLGTSCKAPVLSIGAVFFDLTKTYGEFYVNLHLNQQLDTDIRKVDADTIKWWMNQDKKAKQVFGDNETDVKEALRALSEFITNAAEEVYIWSNGPSFDVSILESLYNDFKMPIPWKYSKVLDYRTIKRFLGKDLKVKYSGVAHNALDDAKTQARYIQECLQKFYSNKK